MSREPKFLLDTARMMHGTLLELCTFMAASRLISSLSFPAFVPHEQSTDSI